MSVSLVWTALLILIAALPLVRSRYPETNIFPGLLWIGAAYYAVAGPLYWLYAEDGYFAGVNWASTLPTASLLFSVASVGYLASYRISQRFLRYRQRNAMRVGLSHPVPFLNHFFLFVGLSSAAFVYASSGSQGGFFLIAYQLSDVAIPAIVAGVACNMRKRTYWMAAAMFSAYAVFTGFRYKLVLLWFPLWLLVASSQVGWRRIFLLTCPPVLGVLVFALIAILRSKFSGLDFGSLAYMDSRLALYAVFSETNILFGLSSILETVVPAERYVYLRPFLDSVLELMPRAIMPDRETGAQIFMVLEGLYTYEGYNSATTYPFFGEYLMMGGYLALFLGVAIAGFLCASFAKITSRGASSWSLAIGGASIVAVLFGYYYVSRGYLPQFTKALICVYLPYLMVLKSIRKRARA